MWGLSVAATVVVVVVAAVMPAMGAFTPKDGLSWCSESKIHNLRVTKDENLVLGLIPVVVNNTLQQEVVDEVFIRQEEPCSNDLSGRVDAFIDGEQAKLVLQDGEIILFYRAPDTIPIFQRVDEFCITANSESPEEVTYFLAKLCFPISRLQIREDEKVCANTTCIRKCCPPMTSLSSGSMCAPVEDWLAWHPSQEPEPITDNTIVHMLYGPPPNCGNALMYNEFFILPSGTLDINGLRASADKYCIDTFNDPSQPMALVCQEEVTSEYCEWKQWVLKPVLLGVSSVCLIFVWFVYISVAKLRRFNEGRCILSLVSALFVAHVALIILSLTTYENLSPICVVTGRLCHFSLLASYFWMNVLSFHTFVQLRSQQNGKWEKPMVFRLYSLYAWGLPLVLMVVTLVIDKMQVEVLRSYIDVYCWFFDAFTYWIHLYGPMLLLILVNVGFFVGCVVVMSRRRGRVTFTPSLGQHHNFSAWLYVRLFILMGILWLMEVVSWGFLSYCSILEWIFDIINSLHGVFIFIVTICCRRNLKVFHCGRPQLIENGSYNNATCNTLDGSEMAVNPLVT